MISWKNRPAVLRPNHNFIKGKDVIAIIEPELGIKSRPWYACSRTFKLENAEDKKRYFHDTELFVTGDLARKPIDEPSSADIDELCRRFACVN